MKIDSLLLREKTNMPLVFCSIIFDEIRKKNNNNENTTVTTKVSEILYIIQLNFKKLLCYSAKSLLIFTMKLS